MTVDLCGVHVGFSGYAPAVLSLLRDFAGFGASRSPADIELFLMLGRPTGPPAPFWAIPAKRALAWSEGDVRHVLYDDGARARFDFAAGQGEVTSEDEGRLREIAYTSILGLAGEKLDALGLHRAHALGFVYAGQGGILLLDSGGGKSELALRMARTPDFDLLSDESPLLGRAASLFSFPTRLSFRPGADLERIPTTFKRPFLRRGYGMRTVVDTGFFAGKFVKCAPLAWILLGQKPVIGRGCVRNGGRTRAMMALLDGLVVGRGIAQMAEWRIRVSSLPALGAASLNRLSAAWAATARARIGVMDIDRDPDRNLSVLREWLDA